MEQLEKKPRKPRVKKETLPGAPKKTRARKAKTEAVAPEISKNTSNTLGIKKTALMLLAESYGDTGLMNPRSIDPIVYMLAEMGESAFGPDVIKNCSQYIPLTNSGFSKKKALGFLADRICRFYLPTLFSRGGKSDTALKLQRMPVLNEASYVDYFMTISMLDRDAFRTEAHPLIADLTRMVAGYETEQAYPICSAVTLYFKQTRDPRGFENLLNQLCLLVKTVY